MSGVLRNMHEMKGLWPIFGMFGVCSTSQMSACLLSGEKRLLCNLSPALLPKSLIARDLEPAVAATEALLSPTAGAAADPCEQQSREAPCEGLSCCMIGDPLQSQLVNAELISCIASARGVGPIAVSAAMVTDASAMPGRAL